MKFTSLAVPALIIFGKKHFLLISENEICHEIKHDGITSFHGLHAEDVFRKWLCKTLFLLAVFQMGRVARKSFILGSRSAWTKG